MLLRINAAGTVMTLALTADIGAPTSIVHDPAANVLYVAGDQGPGWAVHRVDPISGAVELVADGFAELRPASLEFAADSLWVADYGWSRVYRFQTVLFADGFESGSTSAWSSSVGE